MDPRTVRGATAAVAAAVLVAMAVTGCSRGTEAQGPTTTGARSAGGSSSGPAGTGTPGATEATGDAASAARALTVKGRAPRTGYDRERFGGDWVDTDGNGCGTRDDILAAQLVDIRQEGSCEVVAGALDDPYTATRIDYVRGGPPAVDIDHVVALGDAWVKGAFRWSEQTRIAFANDPLNLLAVDYSANRSKGDGDAATWLPPNRAYRCEYVARQVAVKTAYRVWVTAAEQQAMLRVLAGCPGQPLPGGGAGPVEASSGTGGAPPVSGAPSSPPAGGDEGPVDPGATEAVGLDPDYGTCEAAVAAGAGPYTVGVDPEAAYYRDGDGDGVVCER